MRRGMVAAALIQFFLLLTVSLPSAGEGERAAPLRRAGDSMHMKGGMMAGSGMMRGMMDDMMRNMEEIDRKTEFSSDGERIYFRGMDSNGGIIKNSHGMEVVGCAMCHGADGRGIRMMMMDVPPLRWDYLTEAGGHTHPNGRSHPAFTESSFKACVLGGVDPAGNGLSTMMPRCEMTGEDLDNLIEYLKTK